MNLCIFADDYPSEGRPVYTFVKQMVDEFTRKGNKCCVISPYSFIHHKDFCRSYSTYQVEGGEVVTVIRPNYLTFSTLRIGCFSPSKFFHRRAIRMALRKVPFIPDVIYAHFWKQGINALDYATYINKPLFVATGESNIKNVLPANFDRERLNKETIGVICVSTKNKDESIGLGLTTENKCVVIPNAVDTQRFKKLDKNTVRKELGMPEDGFIIAYVGWFNERKGIKRVIEALNGINGKPVYSILIGGNDKINCQNVLIKGRFPHEDIPKYLNAADAFVLPTLKEGCCNAVVEAMACGLPIISSNLSFNLDVLNESNSILIDPTSIAEIRAAIIEIRDNREKRKALSEGALSSAKELAIGPRAERILNFIETSVKK